MTKTTKTNATKKNETFELIAQQILGIETLERRNMDSLDFHDLSVASLWRALDAAFEAGAAYEAGRQSR